MYDENQGSDILSKVWQVVMLVIIVVVVIISIGIAAGPMTAKRELQVAQRHHQVIEELASQEEWGKLQNYLDENDLYGNEYQKYLDVYDASTQVKAIENKAAQMQKYADTPVSEYYTQQDKDDKLQESAEEWVEDMQYCYQWLRRDIYDRAIEGNEFELLELLTSLEECMASCGITENQKERMCREDSYRFKETRIFSELVIVVLSHYTAQ